MFISFNGGQAVISEVTGDFPLEPGASTFAPRYALADGVVVDSYPGLTDDEVAQSIGAGQAAVIAASLPEVRLTQIEFLALFTQQELENIYTAAKQHVRLEVFIDKVRMAQYISLAEAVASISELVQFGLITSARAARAKAGLPPE